MFSLIVLQHVIPKSKPDNILYLLPKLKPMKKETYYNTWQSV